MKKILIITITTVALLSLFSCGKKDATGSGSTFSLKGSGS